MTINVLQYLERAAEKYPEKPALADETSALTYREYREKAAAVGSCIAHKTGVRNRAVAVFIGRNVESVVAFMGCVYSGNFYVPVDLALPAERIAAMLDSLQPAMLLNASGKDCAYPDAVSYGEAAASPVDEPALRAIRGAAVDLDPLYAIFTSGSTGVPKGVLVAHRSVIDLVEQFGQVFGFDETLVFGNQAPFDFDVSVKDLYNAMRLGATVQILPKKLFMMPLKLIDYLNSRKVSILIWAVSALRIVADFKTLEKIEPQGLRYIMFSGETMPVKTLNYWRAHVPAARFVNLYGPTEITCNCTYYEIDREFSAEESLPIGHAFPNTRVVLLDEAGSPITEAGQEGELCVGGSCLALGYWNAPAKTAESFAQAPGVTAYPCRFYHTGDMAYYNARGELVFAARRDFQIKHMGHRIELGEIETLVAAMKDIDIGCCLYDGRHNKILLVYQAQRELTDQIVKALGKKLPKYMWPNRYIRMDRLPLNKNSKIDRQALHRQYVEAEP